MKNIFKSVALVLLTLVVTYFLFTLTNDDKNNINSSISSPNSSWSSSIDNSINDDLSQVQSKDLKIDVIDVGKADAILLTTENKAMMIDTGEDNDVEKVLEVLNEKNITTLDYLIITHFDKDHVGGAAGILENIKVKNIITPDYEKPSDEFKAYQAMLNKCNLKPILLHEKMDFTLGNANVTVFPPEKNVYAQSNDYSLITAIKYGEKDFLFMGDAEDVRLAEFLDDNETEFDFIKMPHHGRYANLSEELLKEVSPQFAVITCSAKKPSDTEVLNILNENNVKTFETVNGDVFVSCDGNEIKVSQ